MFIRQSEYELLLQQKEDALRQCEYWQKQYERERLRNDKLTESLLMTNGLPAPSIREEAPARDHPAPQDIKKYMSELFEEEIKDTLDEGEEAYEN